MSTGSGRSSEARRVAIVLRIPPHITVRACQEKAQLYIAGFEGDCFFQAGDRFIPAILPTSDPAGNSFDLGITRKDFARKLRLDIRLFNVVTNFQSVLSEGQMDRARLGLQSARFFHGSLCQAAMIDCPLFWWT